VSLRSHAHSQRAIFSHLAIDGTFGIAVAFKLRLMKTKAFVRLTMAPVGTFDDMTKRSVAIAETAVRTAGVCACVCVRTLTRTRAGCEGAAVLRGSHVFTDARRAHLRVGV
jgi:hypothetical protein